jgi:hypothetical protein
VRHRELGLVVDIVGDTAVGTAAVGMADRIAGRIAEWGGNPDSHMGLERSFETDMAARGKWAGMVDDSSSGFRHLLHHMD